MNRPQAAALALSGLAAGFSIGCGAPLPDAGAMPAREGLQPFQLLIDWQVEPTYLGVYLARERGHFEQLGLDVEIVDEFAAFLGIAGVQAEDVETVPIDGSELPLLTSGQVDAALNYVEMSPTRLSLQEETFQLALADHGVGGYGLNVIASRAAYDDAPG